MTSLHASRLVLSSPAEDDEKPYSKYRESSGIQHSKANEQDKTPSTSEWVDIEDKPVSRRRKRSRRTVARVDGPVSTTKRPARQSISDLGRFFPKLSQILETGESRPSQHSPARDDVSVGYRRSVRGRNLNVQRRPQDSLLRLSPSLLSVVSGLTAATDRSSGSNSTVTQRSYSRSAHMPSDTPSRRSRAAQYSKHASISPPPSYHSGGSSRLSDRHNQDDDARSHISSSTASSHHSSDAGSSMLSGTPSSRSTYPSPTFSRDTPNDGSAKVENRVPRSPSHGHISPEQSEGGYDRAAETSSIASASQYTDDGNEHYDSLLHNQHPDVTDPMPLHPHDYSGRYLDELHRKTSSASHHVSGDGQLSIPQWRVPVTQNEGSPGVSSQSDPDEQTMAPPHAPEAPDISKKTLAGYELLALELSSSSAVKPMYRKFEFLNHRLLLHLQDELAELEEQLRTVDEIVAQMAPETNGHRLPLSRRDEPYHGTHLHHQRTIILGRIFIKTEQYNKAMSSYSSMLRDCVPADDEQVQAYRAWVAEHTPVHEVETQFLHKDQDLVTFNKHHNPSMHVSQTICASLLGGLPFILLGFIPTILSRLMMLTALISVTTAVVLMTRLRQALTLQEWLISIGSYAFCLIVLAFCMPYRDGTSSGM